MEDHDRAVLSTYSFSMFSYRSVAVSIGLQFKVDSIVYKSIPNVKVFCDAVVAFALLPMCYAIKLELYLRKRVNAPSVQYSITEHGCL